MAKAQTMFFPIGTNAKNRREEICGTAALSNDREERAYADPVKAVVMVYIEQLARDGYAEWRLLDNGDIELRFFSGEIFLLGEEAVTRIM